MGVVIQIDRDRRTPAAAARKRGPMTEVRVETRDVFTRPASDPRGATRREMWDAYSLDGRWAYHRHDDEGTTWTVVYLPTGQYRDGYPNVYDAREHTAGKLAAELRWEAVNGAYDPALTVAARAAAQAALGGWLVAAGQTEPEARCECGGLLVGIRLAGVQRWAHLAACDECWTYKAPGLSPDPAVCRHRACGAVDPAPRECVHNGCHGEAVPDGGDGCATGRGECCRCCHCE